MEKCAHFNPNYGDIEELITRLQLKLAVDRLSDIEQTVIFLLYNEHLTQDEAAEILNIYSQSVSRIKIRAIEKLKKFLEGDLYNE